MRKPHVLCVFVLPEMQRIQLLVSLTKPWGFAPPDISVPQWPVRGKVREVSQIEMP